MLEPILQTPISVGESVSKSWRAVTSNLGPMVGFSVVYFIAEAVVGVIPLVGFLTKLLTFIYSVSLFSAFYCIEKAGSTSFPDFFNWTPKFGKMLAAQIVMLLITIFVFLPVIVITFSYFGLSLFNFNWSNYRVFTTLPFQVLIGAIVFGFIGALLLTLCTYALYFIVQFTDLPLMESIKMSWKVGRDHIGQIIVLGFISLGILILGCLALIIGLLIAILL